MTRSAPMGRPPDALTASEALRGPLSGAFPGCAYAIASSGGAVESGVFGYACVEPERIPVRPDTLFDLASLTKPLCTSLLALQAWERGEMDLLEPVSGVRGMAFTPMDILRHEAGFPAWFPLYGLGIAPSEVRGWLLEACPRRESRSNAEYSCLGYILLGFLLEDLLGGDLPSLFAERIALPLGLSTRDACFNPPPDWKPWIAACDLKGEGEGAKAMENGIPPPPVPAGGLWGVANDGNARFLGGAAGNAGLFATDRAVVRLSELYLPETGFLGPRALDMAWRPGMAQRGERRTAGWKCADSPGWGAGAALSRESVGHDGYTGTGAWLDRETGAVLVLLTNRTHPRHPGTDFGPVRAAFIRAALGNPRGGPGGAGSPMVVPEPPPTGSGHREEGP
jgi:CubicO group peptidase (beta-lactamase class C family)